LFPSAIADKELVGLLINIKAVNDTIVRSSEKQVFEIFNHRIKQ
jgi:hypothetical protein